jgi:hypothetical protein
LIIATYILHEIAASVGTVLRPVADHFEGTLWQVDPTHTTISTIGIGGAQPVTVALNTFYEHGTKQYSVEKTHPS